MDDCHLDYITKLKRKYWVIAWHFFMNREAEVILILKICLNLQNKIKNAVSKIYLNDENKELPNTSKFLKSQKKEFLLQNIINLLCLHLFI